MENWDNEQITWGWLLASSHLPAWFRVPHVLQSEKAYAKFTVLRALCTLQKAYTNTGSTFPFGVFFGTQHAPLNKISDANVILAAEKRHRLKQLHHRNWHFLNQSLARSTFDFIHDVSLLRALSACSQCHLQYFRSHSFFLQRILHRRTAFARCFGKLWIQYRHCSFNSEKKRKTFGTQRSDSGLGPWSHYDASIVIKRHRFEQDVLPWSYFNILSIGLVESSKSNMVNTSL